MQVKSRLYRLNVVHDSADIDYEWCLFRRKKLKNVYMNSLQTTGQWKLLTRDPDTEFIGSNSFEEKASDPPSKITNSSAGIAEAPTTTLLKDNSADGADADKQRDYGQKLSDLNAILFFLTTMESGDRLKGSDKSSGIKFVASNVEEMKEPVITFMFSEDSEEKKEDGGGGRRISFSLNPLKRDENESRSGRWYEVYWWNGQIQRDEDIMEEETEQQKELKKQKKEYSLVLKTYTSEGKFEYVCTIIM